MGNIKGNEILEEENDGLLGQIVKYLDWGCTRVTKEELKKRIRSILFNEYCVFNELGFEYSDGTTTFKNNGNVEINHEGRKVSIKYSDDFGTLTVDSHNGDKQHFALSVNMDENYNIMLKFVYGRSSYINPIDIFDKQSTPQEEIERLREMVNSNTKREGKPIYSNPYIMLVDLMFEDPRIINKLRELMYAQSVIKFCMDMRETGEELCEEFLYKIEGATKEEQDEAYKWYYQTLVEKMNEPRSKFVSSYEKLKGTKK